MESAPEIPAADGATRITHVAPQQPRRRGHVEINAFKFKKSSDFKEILMEKKTCMIKK